MATSNVNDSIANAMNTAIDTIQNMGVWCGGVMCGRNDVIRCSCLWLDGDMLCQYCYMLSVAQKMCGDPLL